MKGPNGPGKQSGPGRRPRPRGARPGWRCRPEHGAARLALQRHDPVVHGHGEPRRVGEEPVRDHVLGDLAADLLVAAAEDAQHVGPADDAFQPPVPVGDREPLEPCECITRPAVRTRSSGLIVTGRLASSGRPRWPGRPRDDRGGASGRQSSRSDSPRPTLAAGMMTAHGRLGRDSSRRGPGRPAAMPAGAAASGGHGGPRRCSSWPMGAGVSRSWPQLRPLAGLARKRRTSLSSGAEGPTPWTLAGAARPAVSFR